MQNKAKNKESKNLNILIVYKLTLQCLDKVEVNLSESSLFKIYIKINLLKKTLSKDYLLEIPIFSKNFKFKILKCLNKQLEEIDNSDNNTQNNSSSEFCISEETIIEIEFDLKEKEININDNNNKESSQNDLDQIEILRGLLEHKLTLLDSKNDEEQHFVSYDSEVERIFNFIDFSLEKSFIYNKNSNNNFLNKGVIIHGPKGVGKTQLLRKIYYNYYQKYSFIDLKIEKLFLEEDSLTYLQNIFNLAKLSKPCLILFEDIDKIFYKSEGEGSNLQIDDKRTKLFFRFLNFLDNFTDNNNNNNDDNKDNNNQIFVIATCISIDNVDLEITKRLSLKLSLDPPKQKQRKELFEHFAKFFKFNNSITDINNELNDTTFEILSHKSHGYVASDILQVYK